MGLRWGIFCNPRWAGRGGSPYSTFPIKWNSILWATIFWNYIAIKVAWNYKKTSIQVEELDLNFILSIRCRHLRKFLFYREWAVRAVWHSIPQNSTILGPCPATLLSDQHPRQRRVCRDCRVSGGGGGGGAGEKTECAIIEFLLYRRAG